MRDSEDLARSSPLRVLIADDHRLMREGTAALLAADAGIEVVGLASGGREAVELATQLKPDVALLDLGMPGVDGLEACAAIRARLPEVRVLMLTVSEDALDVRGLVGRAAGYLLKHIPPEDLVEAVRGASMVMAPTAPPVEGLWCANARCSSCSGSACATARSPNGWWSATPP